MPRQRKQHQCLWYDRSKSDCRSEVLLSHQYGRRIGWPTGRYHRGGQLEDLDEHHPVGHMQREDVHLILARKIPRLTGSAPYTHSIINCGVSRIKT